jgi:RNA polymerase sigma-70 factor (ECF subfamily)
MSYHRELELHFERIVTEHQNALFVALKRMLPTAEAEEVLQEASLKVWLCLYSLDRDAIKPYWYRAARNLALSRLRHEKVHREASPLLQLVFDEASYEDSSKLLELQESQTLIVEAINALPPICRNVFVFRKIEGYSQKEIAETLGISVNTVENHIANGMRSCREFIRSKLRASADLKRSQVS